MPGRVLGGLTTRGRCLLAAGFAAAVSAVVLDERDLLRVGVLLVALPLLSAALLGLRAVPLRVSRSVAPAALSVGAPGQVELTLHAQARLPVAGVLITDGVPALLGTQPRYALGALGAGAAASVRYQLTPRIRGRHQLGPAQVRLADPFGLVEVDRPLAGTIQVLVRPELVALTGAPALHLDSAETGGVAGSVRAAQHTVQDALVRPYVDGDDLRSVHWRSSARRDELMVRPQEQRRQSGTVVLLDVRVRAHHGSGQHSSLERAISLAASCAAHLGGGAAPVRLITSDGVDLGVGEAALEQLALLRPSDRAGLAGAADVGGHEKVIAILGALDEQTARELHALGSPAGPGWALILGTAGPAATALRATGWVVLVIEDSTGLAQAWEKLCAARPAGALL